MTSSLPKLENRKFLQIVYDHFVRDCKWPLAADLQAELRDYGRLQFVAEDVGPLFVRCNMVPGGRCHLTLRGVSVCNESEDDTSTFLAAIRYLAGLYVDGQRHNISAKQIGAALGIDDERLKRLVAILEVETNVWQSAENLQEPLKANFDIHSDVVFHKDDIDLDSYWGKEDRLQIQVLERAQRYSSASSSTSESHAADSTIELDVSAVNIASPVLQQIVQHDLAELNRVMGCQAWKAATILAGSCLESLLHDLWSRREDEAEARFGNRWPRKVSGYELAQAAADLGYIRKEHQNLADMLRKWRNLIHPAAAIDHPKADKTIAQLLVAALNFLIQELAGSHAV